MFNKFKILYLIILPIDIYCCPLTGQKPNIIIDKLEDYVDVNDDNLSQKLREICKIDSNVKDEDIKKEYDNIMSYFINTDNKHNIKDILEKKKIPANYVYDIILIFKYDKDNNKFILYKVKENHRIWQFTEYFVVGEYNIECYYRKKKNIEDYKFPELPTSNDVLIDLFKDLKADYLMFTLSCEFIPKVSFLIKDLSRRQEFNVEDYSKKL